MLPQAVASGAETRNLDFGTLQGAATLPASQPTDLRHRTGASRLSLCTPPAPGLAAEAMLRNAACVRHLGAAWGETILLHDDYGFFERRVSSDLEAGDVRGPSAFVRGDEVVLRIRDHWDDRRCRK
jgi:hypothetical protein